MIAKRWSSSWVLAVLVAIAAYAVTSRWTRDAGGSPSVDDGVRMIELGLVSASSRHELETIVRNSAEVRLEEVSTEVSCVCLQVKHAPDVLDPGAAGAMLLGFEAPSSPGAFDYRVRVSSKSDPEWTLVAAVTGRVALETSHYPPGFVIDGDGREVEMEFIAWLPDLQETDASSMTAVVRPAHLFARVDGERERSLGVDVRVDPALVHQPYVLRVRLAPDDVSAVDAWGTRTLEMELSAAAQAEPAARVPVEWRRGAAIGGGGLVGDAATRAFLAHLEVGRR